MSEKYTKGPWFVRQEEKWPFYINIVDSNGQIISSEPRYAYSSKQETIEDVMTAYRFPKDERDAVIKANEIQLANAHLRAAAPELLELLERAVGRLEIAHRNGDSIMKEWVIDARAAILKATGEQA